MYSWCFYLFCACTLTVSANVIRNNDLYKLDIVHYNDFHARFEETSVEYPICKTNDSECLGGFARLYQEIQTLLQDKPDALLLNAGDVFQGTYWYTLLKWNVTQQFINMLPNDAHALGNHEFDDGVAGLVPYIKTLRAPVIAANLEVPKDSELLGLYQPHVVVEKNGRKIGIIGLITKKTEVLSNGEGVKFLEPIPIVKREAQLLTKKGVDIIVVLSHCGLDVDQQIAKEVGEDIDIIVGGHTHSLLWNGESPSKEPVAGPYPVVIESTTKPGHKVLVVTASAYSKYLGNMTTYFDDHGELQSFEGTPVFLNRSIPEDPKIKALMQPYADHIQKITSEVVGYTNDVLDMESCAENECALGNIVSDGLLNITNELYPSELPNVVFLLSGMLRSTIPKGDITKGALINTLPFTNKGVTFVMSGKYVMEALKLSLGSKRAHQYAPSFKPQISGLQLMIDSSTGEMISVMVKTHGEYRKFDVNQDYQVTTTDFLSRGGNGFSMFKTHSRNLKVLGVDEEILERYVRRISPITPHLDNRLVFVS